MLEPSMWGIYAFVILLFHILNENCSAIRVFKKVYIRSLLFGGGLGEGIFFFLGMYIDCLIWYFCVATCILTRL